MAENGVASVVVHIRYQGRTLCGFNDNRLGDWPEGHNLTSLRNRLNASCEECRKRAGIVDEDD